MARPTTDAIRTYMSITGASEPLALQKLEYKSNYRCFPQYNFVDMKNQTRSGQHGLFPFLSAAGSFRPSLLLDPNYRRNLLNQIGGSAFAGHAPLISRREEAMGFPVEATRGNEQPHPSGLRPAFEDVTRTSSHHGSEIHSNVIRDDESHLYGNELEEEMIQAALEASKKDFEDSSGIGLPKRQLHQEDDELARAISLSLKTVELEKAKREQTVENGDQ